MNLNKYVFKKAILIDDAGWGDLILGVVIGALRLYDHEYMERRISLKAFQSEKFEKKEYLDESLKIGQEILEAMRPDEETYFKVCSGYVLSKIREFLQGKGYHVEEAEIRGELQERVERGFKKWCLEVGVPSKYLKTKQRFFPILNWVAERFELRENLVKTGWKSWQKKWRQEAFEIHIKRLKESRERYFSGI